MATLSTIEALFGSARTAAGRQSRCRGLSLARTIRATLESTLKSTPGPRRRLGFTSLRSNTLRLDGLTPDRQPDHGSGCARRGHPAKSGSDLPHRVRVETAGETRSAPCPIAAIRITRPTNHRPADPHAHHRPKDRTRITGRNLPDAPGDPAGRPGKSARSAAWRWSRCWSAWRPSRTRTDRHDAPVLDRAGALTLPVFVLEMGGHFWAGPTAIGQQASNWIQLLLATPVVLWAGWPFFERGWQSLVNRSLNMFTLIAMGTGVAWLYSVVGDLAPGIFRPVPQHGTARSRSISRRRRSSPCSCCSARCSNCAPASRPAARSGAARPAPKTARIIRDDGSDEEVALDRSRSAIGCACGPARRCRSTAGDSRPQRSSMNRWSPANRCR
jgi:hypothetical protein